MPKATFTTPAGTVVTIEGTQDEIVSTMARLEARPSDGGVNANAPMRSKIRSKPTPAGVLADLIAERFFSKPQELGAVKLALEERGHFYPVTTLSPVLLRLVKKKELRRIKEKKRWLYVG